MAVRYTSRRCALPVGCLSRIRSRPFVSPHKEAANMPGPVSSFIDHHFRHFNAASLKDAAEGYTAHLDRGGRMLVTLAGAMSTAELGISLAEMIRAGKVHAIS